MRQQSRPQALARLAEGAPVCGKTGNAVSEAPGGRGTLPVGLHLICFRFLSLARPLSKEGVLEISGVLTGP